MNAKELKTILDTTKYPVAYNHFKEAQNAPFIVFTLAYTNNALADDVVYKVRNRWVVYLCTDEKDVAAEEAVESVFYTNHIVWDKSEDYIESEGLYEIEYTIMEV